MAATFHPDKVSRAAIVETPTLVRIVRTGLIKGLTTLGLPPAEIFAKCGIVPGVPAYGDAYPAPEYSYCKCNQRIFEGIEGNSRKARATFIYESATGGLVPFPATFVLERRTNTIDNLTEIDPATGMPIVTVWRDPVNPSVVIARTTAIRIKSVFQRLIATGFYVGAPPDSMLSALNSVNDAPWRGLPKGYWHYCDQSDVTKNFGGTYQITLELETKLTEDWSTYTTLRNPNGTFIKVSTPEVAFLRAEPYKFGMTVRNGITKVGPYRLKPFNTIFGFGGI